MKGILLLHNAILSIGSAIMFLGMVHEIVVLFFRDGTDALTCYSSRQFYSRLGFWTYVFLWSKIYEFFDTVFIVLNKKDDQFSFLHVYHHVITFYLVWICLDHYAPFGWVLEITNSFIHIWMYLYYGLTVMGFRPTWKSTLTVMQIIQFILDIVGLSIWPYYTFVQGKPCDGSVHSYSVVVFVLISFLSLFIQFYLQRYKTAKKKSQ
jgi:hypothetical protein